MSLYKTRILDDNTFLISFVKPEGLRTKQAQYAQLIYPPISPIASHPISISSGVDSDTIEFVIRVAGPWTTMDSKVPSLLKDKAFMTLHNTLYMVGPFTEHSIADAVYENEVAFIAAGAGVTPFLNFIRSFRGHCDAVNIIGHVTSRNFVDFELVLQAVHEAAHRGVSSEIYVYWTGKAAKKRDFLKTRTNHYGFVFEDSTQDDGPANILVEDNEVGPRKMKRQRTMLVMNETEDVSMSQTITQKGDFVGNQEASEEAILEVSGVIGRDATAKRRRTLLKKRQFRRSSSRVTINHSDQSPSKLDIPRNLILTAQNQRKGTRVNNPTGDDASLPDIGETINLESEEESIINTDAVGILPKLPEPVVSVHFRDNRIDMEEVLASTTQNLYFVGPGSLADLFNQACVDNDRKLFYTTWS
eukprot:CAMPEP_0114994802 /NCGR_PEP_ID=MMETSP0216-20121206/13348_1 /TAXON_ID=223996 /ORGANISM="Protocruzia adherens, Strain Boccale" /LENGTH=415 /DNA_ID=CAMNT_0002358717 /DNA_START=136 /DNA_END=1384 /DNA_ORIENTATION=-